KSRLPVAARGYRMRAKALMRRSLPPDITQRGTPLSQLSRIHRGEVLLFRQPADRLPSERIGSITQKQIDGNCVCASVLLFAMELKRPCHTTFNQAAGLASPNPKGGAQGQDRNIACIVTFLEVVLNNVTKRLAPLKADFGSSPCFGSGQRWSVSFSISSAHLRAFATG